jgi:hypothetical protein
VVIRLISFAGGALFGAIGAVVDFHYFEKSDIDWGIVGLAALVLGILAALFGKKFWDTAVGIWP